MKPVVLLILYSFMLFGPDTAIAAFDEQTNAQDIQTEIINSREIAKEEFEHITVNKKQEHNANKIILPKTLTLPQPKKSDINKDFVLGFLSIAGAGILYVLLVYIKRKENLAKQK